MFSLLAFVALISPANADRHPCQIQLTPNAMLREKFDELLEDRGGFYVRGTNYILKHPRNAPDDEAYRYMNEDEAARFLAHFDADGRFVRAGLAQIGLFNFVLTDDRRLYLFRAGPRDDLTPESYFHTYPVKAGPVAAAGEMLFDHGGHLRGVNPYTGHYRIDVDLSNFQIEAELVSRSVPLGAVRFFPMEFPAETLAKFAHHSVGR